MIDEQSSASGHDYASDRSAIGAGNKCSKNTSLDNSSEKTISYGSSPLALPLPSLPTPSAGAVSTGPITISKGKAVPPSQLNNRLDRLEGGRRVHLVTGEPSDEEWIYSVDTAEQGDKHVKCRMDLTGEEITFQIPCSHTNMLIIYLQVRAS